MDCVGVLQVASLLERMESLHNITLHVNIQTALNRHHKALCIAQARRREEITNMSKHQRQRANFSEDRGDSCGSDGLLHSSLSQMLPLLTRFLFRRHPVAGHCTEGPSCYHEETPQRPVVRSPDDTTNTCQAGPPRYRGGHSHREAPLSNGGILF